VGVVTKISLDEVNRFFPSYNFTELTPTSDGIMDTTYIVKNLKESFILKKYERDIKEKVQRDSEILEELYNSSLNVPKLLDSSNEWYLYKKLRGVQPKVVKLYHIQSLARFMAKFHSQSKYIESHTSFFQNYDLVKILNFTKKNYFFYFKRLQYIQNYKAKNDGFIHGDIFKDNTVFDKNRIGVFDFIDSGNGEFLFDVAVALVAFNPQNRTLYINIFINSYNQKSPKKIEKKELQKMLKIASTFYALLRIDKYKNIKKARELL